MRDLHPSFFAFWLAAVVAVPATAQTAVSIDGGLAGAGSAFDEPLAQLGVRIAGLKPSALSVDFSLALFPTLIAEGAVVGMPDLDISYPVSVGEQLRLIPRLGASALAGAGADGAAAIPGYNTGLGVVALIGARAAVRFDYTYRRLIEDGDSYPVSSLTLGIAWTH